MKIKKRFFLFILFLFIAYNSAAQESPNPFTIYNKGIVENNYLTPLIELQKDEFTKSEQWRSMVPDLLGYLYSYTGEYKTAFAQLDRGRDKLLDVPYYKDLTSSPIDVYEPQTAVEAITTLADKNQVVMINEEHDTPMHRAFTTRLLPILYAKGFRYFAAETLGDRDKEIMTRGYPTHKTGFYSNDPVFGEMLRAAVRLGFKIVPYEYSSEKLVECRKQGKDADFCQNERERGQAQNLYDRILRDDPKAKVLVHVGRGHNQQIKLETWAQMGWHFKEISGITPLSVNQMLSERSEPKYESGLYRYVVNKWKFKEPSVFRNNADNYFKTHGYDLAVFHPRSTLEKGRPIWLKNLAGRRAYTINLKRLKLSYHNQFYRGVEPILIQAFYAAESADTIPADQIILYPEKEIPALMLQKGKYRIRALDKLGKVIDEYQI
jgi:tetratricopeptide (TPR) repeat protein